MNDESEWIKIPDHHTPLIGKKLFEQAKNKIRNVKRKYVSLDDLNIRDMARNDPALFLQIHKPPVLINEVQYAPKLFTYIKIYIDSDFARKLFSMPSFAIRCVRRFEKKAAAHFAGLQPLFLCT